MLHGCCSVNGCTSWHHRQRRAKYTHQPEPVGFAASSSHKKNSAAIKRRHTHRVEARTVPSTNDGAPCTSVDEVLERWNEHYQQMLNHAPATQCLDLNDAAANARPEKKSQRLSIVVSTLS